MYCLSDSALFCYGRWAQAPGQKPLEGGSLTVECGLCPVRHGAFKRTVDCSKWVHMVCAMWHPDVSVLPGRAGWRLLCGWVMYEFETQNVLLAKFILLAD